MSAVACIAEGHATDDASVREWMSGNICRCSAYPQITAAVLAAAREGPGVRDFAYARAGTAESAAGALADPHTSVIAGGTELLNWFRLGIAAAGPRGRHRRPGRAARHRR
jgi:Aerobic-type carbon monoxide dehydrogenase, small subunit CoxS/CutS homologs